MSENVYLEFEILFEKENFQMREKGRLIFEERKKWSRLFLVSQIQSTK